MSELNHWKTDKLFDDAPYRHKFHLPNVIPLPVRVVENNGHDETFDHLKCEVIQFDAEAEHVQARIFDFPRKMIPPDEAA